MGQAYRILLTAFRGSSDEKLIGSFAENRPDLKMVFIHIPYLKNITDFNFFRERIFQAFSRIQSMKNV